LYQSPATPHATTPERPIIDVNGEQRKATADQLATTFSKQRLTERLAILTKSDMWGIGRAIRVQVALERFRTAEF